MINPRTLKWPVFIWLTAIFILIMVPSVNAEDRLVKIGVLAKRGEKTTIARWKPTADYLTDIIDGYQFTIVPLDFTNVRRAVAEAEVDFIVF